MSLTGHYFVEIKHKPVEEDGLWFLVATLQPLDGGAVPSLLAHPWGKWDGEGYKPVVRPRGFPKDMSLQVKHRVMWTVHEDPQPEDYRVITLAQAKKRKLKRYGSSGYWVDPHEWRCSTWLTPDEVQKAEDAYAVGHPRRSADLRAMLGIFKAYKNYGALRLVAAWS